MPASSRAPRLIGISATGERIALPELTEIQLCWEEGLPVSLVLAPEHLTGQSFSLEIGSEEDAEDQLLAYGGFVLRPGACNALDISIETAPLEQN